MALHIPCQDPANQHPPPPGEEETQQTHFPACEIICIICGCKATHSTSHSANCVQCVIYSFFFLFFPCGVWLFQEALPWFGPLIAGSSSSGNSKGWWCPGNGEIQQQHCPTLSWVGLAALPWNLGSCNKGLVLLLFGL